MLINKKIITAALTSACLTWSAAGHAEDTDTQSPAKFQWVASVGLTFGGDDLADVNFEDSDFDDEVEAGGLIYLGFGGNYRFADSPLSIQGVFGYHFDSVDADNGDVTFDRTFIDVIGFYNTGAHRFGIGLTQHFGPTLDVDFDFADGSIDFDDATGIIFEYDYMISEQFGIGLRYTDIEYDPSDFNADAADGSNIGIFMNVLF